MTEKSKTTFADETEIQKKFGKIKIEEREQTDIQTTFLGYPIKHQNVTEVSKDPPTYMKSNGKIEFVAGYWGILFANGWSPAFCPKLETVEKNKVVGPFKNKMEMTNHIKNLNNKAVGQ